jgi:hypothetical protein
MKARPDALESASVRLTEGAPIGKRLKIWTDAWFDEDQPHLLAAFQARHLNTGLKAGTGWRSAGDLHCILVFKRGDATPPRPPSQDIPLRPANQIAAKTKLGHIGPIVPDPAPGAAARPRGLQPKPDRGHQTIRHTCRI